MLYTVYKYINILSLDVAAGAVISALFFGELLHVDILPYGLIVLALTVWIIYTADHLSDAKKIEGKAASERHLFHQRNFKALLVCMIIAAIVAAIMLLFIRRPVFVSGLGLTAIVIFYLLLHGRLFFFKEMLVAVLYTAGILLPSVAVTETNITSFHLAIFGQFFLIVLINLLVFAWFDFEQDWRDKLPSFVTHFGKATATKVIAYLFVVFFVFSGYLIVSGGFSMITIVLLMMGFILLVIFTFPKYFRQWEYYRMIGDAIFLVPLIALFG